MLRRLRQRLLEHRLQRESLPSHMLSPPATYERELRGLHHVSHQVPPLRVRGVLRLLVPLRVHADGGPVAARLVVPRYTLVNPYVIAFIGSGAAVTVAGFTQNAVASLVVPTALLAGWSTAWSP